MASFYDAAFGINLAVCVFLRLGSNYLLKDNKKDEEKTSETPVSTLEQQRLFKSFQFQWLFVYMTFMAADWLQGPYFYSLYSSYGFTETQIAIFFLAGFTSGMIFGTFIGSLADKHGRKKLSIVCGVLYGTACAIRFINDRDVIVVSHILSGISSSLLHSVFEVWMITEHSKRSFPQHLLSETLSWATFLNGIVSIVAGVSATFLVQIYGVQGPFGASSMLFFLGALIVSLTWNENYGDQKTEFNQAFGNAVKRLFAEPRFISLGLIQSLFETTMYTFVFLWAPCLTAATDSDEPLPFGTIFANLMVSIMIGSSVFSIMMRLNVQLINIAKILFVIAAIAMYSCSLFITGPHLLGLFFCVFEFCCGIYFPALGTLKAITVPDEMRSTMSNLFRIPLNFMVMIVLLKVDDFDKTTLFFICVGELLLGLLLCFFFQAKTEEENARASRLPSNSESK